MSGQIGSLEELAAFMKKKKKKIFFTEDGHPFVLRGGVPGVEYRAGSVVRFQPVEPGAMVAWLNQRDLPSSRKAGWLVAVRDVAELGSATVGVVTAVVTGLKAVDAVVNPPKPRRQLRNFWPRNR